MHNSNGECIYPENLRETPGKCSEEQIRECHGDDESHRCTTAED